MTRPNEEQERRWRIFRARRKHHLGTPADLADIPASDLMTTRQLPPQVRRSPSRNYRGGARRPLGR